jgi:arylsulfatase A
MKLIRLISSLATAVFLSSLAMAADRPNVVIVYIDDMGWKDLSCYGSTFYKTPVIDQLAAEGTRFTDAYAACQICSPSRRALLTGKYPARSNFTDLPGRAAATGKKLIDPIQEDIMPNSEVLFSEIFQAAGYYTGFLGKWHLEVADVGEVSTEHGFDVWDEINSEGGGGPALIDGAQDPKEVSEITDKSIAFVQDAVTNQQPFMLYMSHRTVHVQLQTTPGLHAKYGAKAPGENGQDNPYMGGMVEDLDTELGRFLQALETLGVADNTIIVFTSDNGGLEVQSGMQVTSQAPLRGGKGTEFEGGVRVPMIFKGPGILENTVTSTPTIQTDLYPTLVELAGLSEDETHVHDGVSLASIALNGTTSPELDARETIFWDYPDYKAKMVPASYARKGDWVLVLYNEQEISPYGGKPNALYSLSNDIGQVNNLIGQFPFKAAELYADIVAHRQATGAQMSTANPAYVWSGPPTAITLPGKFEAEDYDFGGEGAGYHDVDGDSGTEVYRTDAVDIEATSDVGGGFEIVSASPGEWMEYHVNVSASGSYDFDLRVATGADNRQVILTLDGAPLATVDVPNTGGDQTWATVTAGGLAISAGNHVLRVEWGAQGGPNLNWIDVETAGPQVRNVVAGSFEDPPNVVGSWGQCHAVWNDAGTGQYEVGQKHLSAVPDGDWIALMSNMDTITQNMDKTVEAGHTVDVTFSGGRAKESVSTAGGGVFTCTFIVGGTRYPMTADTTLLPPNSWQTYTHSVTIANTGDLTLEFKSVSGTPWIDHVRNLTVTRASDYNTYISDPAFGLDPAVQGVDADPDGDRIFNGLEAWFGTHPGTYNSGLVLRATDGLTSTFSHPHNASPPSYQSGIYEWSPNLVDWYLGDGIDGPPSGQNVTVTPNSSGVTATASEHLDSLFLRLRVTLN